MTRHRCREHTWGPWQIDSITKAAVCRCLFCPAIWRERMA